MNHAIKQITPASNWITAGVLTVFVLAFAVFAEGHVRDNANVALTDGTGGMCIESSGQRQSAVPRYR